MVLSFGTPVLKGSAHLTNAPLVFSKPTDLAEHPVIVVALRSQESGLLTAWSVPEGFTEITQEPTTSAEVTSRRRGAIFVMVVTDQAAVPSNMTFTIPGSTSRGLGGMITMSSDMAGALGILGKGQYGGNSVSGGVATLSARTNSAPGLSLVVLGSENVAGVSHTPNATPAGYTKLFEGQNTLDSSTSGSRTAIWLGYKVLATSTFDSISGTYTGGSGYGIYEATITGGMVAPSYPGLSIDVPGGKALLTVINSAGVEVVPAAVETWFPGSASVAAFVATQGGTSSHRGGSNNVPEMSERAYDTSVTKGFPVLEFSCGWTSDFLTEGPFGLGDQYLDRISGVTGNVDATTMTWANLIANYQIRNNPMAPGVYQPFYKLEAFLQKYTPTHVVMVDPKFGWNTAAKINKMLEICNANGGPSRIIIKFDSPVTQTLLVDTAKAAGYTTMNYWGTEVAKLTPEYGTDKWDLIGVRYDADQTMYNTALAIGKKVWAAVIPNQAGYDLAASRGANLMMCSNILGIMPVR